MTATAALTAQNTQGVYGIHETPSNFVQKQIDACVEDIGVDVLKTGENFKCRDFFDKMNQVLMGEVGMLASAQTVMVVANAIREHKIPISVVDPV